MHLCCQKEDETDLVIPDSQQHIHENEDDNINKALAEYFQKVRISKEL